MSDTSHQRIAADVRLGRHVRLRGLVNLDGCVMGDNVKRRTTPARLLRRSGQVGQPELAAPGKGNGD